jgi:hypothetical protein
MKLWPIPQDVDDEISMMLSIKHSCSQKDYIYDTINLTFRDKNRGQNAKAIQLLLMPGEIDPDEWLLENIWSNPIMRSTRIGEAIYQSALKDKKAPRHG